MLVLPCTHDIKHQFVAVFVLVCHTISSSIWSLKNNDQQTISLCFSFGDQLFLTSSHIFVGHFFHLFCSIFPRKYFGVFTGIFFFVSFSWFITPFFTKYFFIYFVFVFVWLVFIPSSESVRTSSYSFNSRFCSSSYYLLILLGNKKPLFTFSKIILLKTNILNNKRDRCGRGWRTPTNLWRCPNPSKGKEYSPRFCYYLN